jgi:anti-sigma factor RsiW
VKSAPLSPQDEQLLEERLPWYVNGSLDAKARAWVDAQLAQRPELQQRLQRERALQRTVQSAARMPAPDVGLDRLMTRVELDTKIGPGTSVRRAQVPPWARWLRVLSTPPVAGAMAVALVAQAGALAWLASTQVGSDGSGDMRSIGVTEARTLRVSFRPDASEAQIRAALMGAGARIVGGPTQLGEYWVASGSTSLEEIRRALQRAQITASMDIDTAGPRGR